MYLIYGGRDIEEWKKYWCANRIWIQMNVQIHYQYKKFKSFEVFESTIQSIQNKKY